MSALHVPRRSRWAPLPTVELTSLTHRAGIELPPPVDDATAMALLRDGQCDVVGQMPWSSNTTFLCRVSDTSSGAAMLTIYKPRHGERPLWDFDKGTLCQREVAAVVVSDMLGWSLVPDTILREGPAGVGALSRFYDHDPDDHYFNIVAGREHRFQQFCAFDVIINNTDRKGGHLLLAADDHVWDIDHGVCFHEQPKLRTVIWEFAGDKISQDILEDISNFACALDQTDATTALSALLSATEIDAMRNRTQHLLQQQRFPLPRGDYHDYPWPTI